MRGIITVANGQPRPILTKRTNPIPTDTKGIHAASNGQDQTRLVMLPGNDPLPTTSRLTTDDHQSDETRNPTSVLNPHHRVHRKPRTASPDELPILIGAVDLPVYKSDRSSAPLVRCNGGLHFHALILIPDRSRLREPLQDHFQTYAHLYGMDGTISKIDVRPVMDGYERVVDYVFKTIKRGRVSYDEGMLILPRTRNELTSLRHHAPGGRLVTP